VKARIVTALDAWADVKRWAGAKGWEGLLEAAGRADDSGDEARRRLREAVSQRDTGRLLALAREPGAADWPADDAVLLARGLRAAEEQESAMRVLRAAQGRLPGDFWLNFELGTRLGRWSPAAREEGIGFLRAAIASRPRFAGAHCNLGVLLHEQRKYEEAKQEYREALRLKPAYAKVHGNLGLLLMAQGKPAEAEAEYREALRLNPDFPETHSDLGRLLAGQGKAAEAEEEYREALRLKSDLPAARNGLGILLQGQNKPAEAEKEYREALRLNPDFPEAHDNLGNLLAGQGKPAEAEKEYREALRLRPDYPDAHSNLGKLWYEQGKPAEAEKEFRAALRLRPDYPDAHYNLGVLLSGQGKAAEAEKEYRAALRLHPDYPEAHCNLGHLLRDLGRFREALGELRRGDELGSRDPRWNYPSAAWVRDCLRLADLDALLPSVLAGAGVPADAGAALGFARVCSLTKRYAAAVRLSATVMEAAPGAANDPRNSIRYNAARTAALAGCGQGNDAPVDEAERARLRGQALAWLRADLAWWAKAAERGNSKALEAVRVALPHWQQDADLAGVRDAADLDKLPEAERADWRKLWADVDALLKKAAPQK
jgi:tetratricopeptide (TPR) repeat protein